MTWALVMYLHQFHYSTLNRSMAGSMTYLYNDSNLWPKDATGSVVFDDTCAHTTLIVLITLIPRKKSHTSNKPNNTHHSNIPNHSVASHWCTHAE